MTDTCKSLEAANEQYSKLSQQVSLSTSAEIRTTGMEEMTSLIENNDLDWHLLQQVCDVMMVLWVGVPPRRYQH